jgi:hypothetical protein
MAFLELLFVPPGCSVEGLAPGGLVPLDEEKGFLLGRLGAPSVQGPLVRDRHLMLEKKRRGAWELWHHGFNHRAFVNGSPTLEAQLQHLDVLELPAGPTFRFLEEPVSTARNLPLEAVAGQAPLDEARLSVWRDFLQERGDPLARRLLWPHQAPHARWLLQFARFERGALLDVEWSHGLATSLSLRGTGGWSPLEARAFVHGLLELPVARCLQHLTVDARAMELDPAQLALALAEAPLPASLRTVGLGQAHVDDVAAQAAARRLASVYAARGLPITVSLQRFSAAWLEVVEAGPHAGVPVGHRYRADFTPQALFVAAGSSHVRVAWKPPGRWLAHFTQLSGILPGVNGRVPDEDLPLREGDVFRLGITPEHVRLRFELELATPEAHAAPGGG